MNSRVARIHREVSRYDRCLRAIEVGGHIQVQRITDAMKANGFHMMEAHPTDYVPVFVLAVTDNWQPDGKPVEWGLEPIMERLKAMDSWIKPNFYSDMIKRRERDDEEKKRTRKNEFRARAADMRGEFSRAVNDINTSTIDCELRRK